MQNKNPPSGFLSGKSAVVTGSTSGIGRAIALELARCGANVLVHGRDSAKARDVTSDLYGLSPASTQNHSSVLADLADQAAHATLVDDAWNWADAEKSANGERTGVDIWVNNAGVDVLTGAAASSNFYEKLTSLWQVDVLATIQLSRLVAERMKARGGSIINIGWDQADTGMAGDSGEMFATIKGAVMAFTRSLSKSAAPTVRVNCVAPGWIKTKWGDGTSDYWNDRATGESLLGRWGTPEDVARTVRFLVSPDADFITGQTLNVNGGSQPWPNDWKANRDG